MLSALDSSYFTCFRLTAAHLALSILCLTCCSLTAVFNLTCMSETFFLKHKRLIRLLGGDFHRSKVMYENLHIPSKKKPQRTSQQKSTVQKYCEDRERECTFFFFCLKHFSGLLQVQKHCGAEVISCVGIFFQFSRCAPSAKTL